MQLDSEDLVIISEHLVSMLETVNKMLKAQVGKVETAKSITSFQSLKLETQTNQMLEYIHKLGNKTEDQK